MITASSGGSLSDEMDDDKAFHLSSVGHIQYLGIRVLSVMSRVDKINGSFVIVKDPFVI